MPFNGFLLQGNSFLAKSLAQLFYLLAGICRLVTNQQLSFLRFVFVNSWRGEGDNPTALMAILMPLMCDWGGTEEESAQREHSQLLSKLCSPLLMMSRCQTHHLQFYRLLLKCLNVLLPIENAINILSSYDKYIRSNIVWLYTDPKTDTYSQCD